MSWSRSHRSSRLAGGPGGACISIKRASACAAFGRSGATGPTGRRGLGTRFLISKRAESGDEVTGRFGGPERYMPAEDGAFNDNCRSMKRPCCSARPRSGAVTWRTPRSFRRNVSRRPIGAGSTEVLERGVLQRAPEVRRPRLGVGEGRFEELCTDEAGAPAPRDGQGSMLYRDQGASGREWRPDGRLEWGVPAGRWGRAATRTSLGPRNSAST